MEILKKTIKHLTLFFIGGGVYLLFELLWRGKSHVTMFVLGGICFVLIGLLNEVYEWDWSILLQMLISSSIITVLELLFGLVLNVHMGLNIWNYTDLSYNFMGQICLQFTVAWFFLSVVAIILDDYCRYWLFNEEKPHYKLV